MNIFHVSWLYDGRFLAGAVVIAPDEDTAVAILDINDEDHTDVNCQVLGPCTDGTRAPRVVCREMM